MGNERLWVSIDRYGIMRPTVLNERIAEEAKEFCHNNNAESNSKSENCNTENSNADAKLNATTDEQASVTVGEGAAGGEAKKAKNQYFKEEWRTKPNWLHWDLSPFHFGTSAAGYLLNKNVSNDALCMVMCEWRICFVLFRVIDCFFEMGFYHCW
jgi:hypothetical protein